MVLEVWTPYSCMDTLSSSHDRGLILSIIDGQHNPNLIRTGRLPQSVLFQEHV